MPGSLVGDASARVPIQGANLSSTTPSSEARRRVRRRRDPPLVRLLSPLRDFLHAEAAGGILLILGAAIALVWANSPWSGSYTSLWHSELSIRIAGHDLTLDLRAWLDDGLMAIFFFVVGLEIKREVTDGHLATRRTAALPAAAAIGGMIAPALIYLAIAGRTAAHGWAVPMATDIALALGAVAIAGARVPSSQRAFLLGLAIVDDIGAIVVIAVAYSTGVSWGWLLIAGGGLATTMIARRLGVRPVAVYVAIGVVVWLAMHEGGIHATLAGVAMGLIAPASPHTPPGLVDVDELNDLSSVEHVRSTTEIARRSVSVVEWLEHLLHPWTSYVIVPVFALANAGIVISASGLREAAGSAITWGIIAGLLLGKPIGVRVATVIAVRIGLADPVEGHTTRTDVGIGAAAGIGFTVALFIADLAFTDEIERRDAKLAILVASVIAGVVSTLVLRGGQRADSTADASRSTSSMSL